MAEETRGEQFWRELSEDILIAVYVPEAAQMTRPEALALALERDQSAAETLTYDSLHMEEAAAAAKG